MVRQEVVEATLERNPNAFRPKIANSPRVSIDGKVLYCGQVLEKKKKTMVSEARSGVYCESTESQVVPRGLEAKDDLV